MTEPLQVVMMFAGFGIMGCLALIVLGSFRE